MPGSWSGGWDRFGNPKLVYREEHEGETNSAIFRVLRAFAVIDVCLRLVVSDSIHSDFGFLILPPTIPFHAIRFQFTRRFDAIRFDRRDRNGA
jgi:hypothetical protein